jgi:hypothetical protein
MTAAGIRIDYNDDPFRIGCMRAVLRRLEVMAVGDPDAPSPAERQEAIERLEQLVNLASRVQREYQANRL